MASNKISPEIKQEVLEQISPKPPSSAAAGKTLAAPVIVLTSSDSESDNSSLSDDDVEGDGDKRPKKKKKVEESRPATNVKLPPGFLDPLPTKEMRLLSSSTPVKEEVPSPLAVQMPVQGALPLPAPEGNAVLNAEYNRKQFWKAGDYDLAPSGDWDSSLGGMDHVRVHPRFLQSNATSHKWVLGAFAELLDNSLDEVCNGATYVNIDMIKNKKDGKRMLMIEVLDNGGGMDPDKMRQCMSLGYSAKCKIADTIGQYGNGFKTSTMRLGADVIVFSRSCGKNGNRSTQSIGLLSYTFLRSTGNEDIIVPMLDYERRGQEWNKIIRSSAADWSKNVDTIVQWSAFSSEADLLQQFNRIKDHGTRIFIYNLWEDDQGLLELDFDTDPHDIQIRGVNRDEKHIQMAQQYPNSRHFLTYRHSLRSYASMLYLRIPPGFRIILRGKDVEHHNIVNDMMMTEEVTYRPQPGADGILRDSDMVAVVNIGFVKDVKAHIDVQGFNVYHKNRLVKPFWRVSHPSGSDGRGVIGVLEANFVEPAHDKQGFECTVVLARLEKKLVEMQKNYWMRNCHKIGYAPCNKKSTNEGDDGGEGPWEREEETVVSGQNHVQAGKSVGLVNLDSESDDVGNGSSDTLDQLKEENRMLRESLKRKEEEILGDLLKDLDEEWKKCKSIEVQLQGAAEQVQGLIKEQESLIDVFSEERQHRDIEEENLRKKLKDASNIIQELLDKVRLRERMKPP